jgi:hypothetical protein
VQKDKGLETVEFVRNMKKWIRILRQERSDLQGLIDEIDLEYGGWWSNGYSSGIF